MAQKLPNKERPSAFHCGAPLWLYIFRQSINWQVSPQGSTQPIQSQQPALLCWPGEYQRGPIGGFLLLPLRWTSALRLRDSQVKHQLTFFVLGIVFVFNSVQNFGLPAKIWTEQDYWTVKADLIEWNIRFPALNRFFFGWSGRSAFWDQCYLQFFKKMKLQQSTAAPYSYWFSILVFEQLVVSM